MSIKHAQAKRSKSPSSYQIQKYRKQTFEAAVCQSGFLHFSSYKLYKIFWLFIFEVISSLLERSPFREASEASGDTTLSI